MCMSLYTIPFPLSPTFSLDGPQIYAHFTMKKPEPIQSMLRKKKPIYNLSNTSLKPTTWMK